MKIKNLLLTLLMMTVVTISCKKSILDDGPTNSDLSLENLSISKDLKAYLANDSAMFSAMYAKARQSNSSTEISMAIKTEADFKQYLKRRGFNPDSVISILNENMVLLSRIKQSYNLSESKNIDKFNNLYDTLFRRSLEKASLKNSEIKFNNKVKSSLLMTTPEGTFPFDTGPAPESPEASKCLEDFIDKWNKNARDYRTNAGNCMVLLPVAGSICTYLSWITLDRKQQKAYAEYKACRWPSVNPVPAPYDSTDVAVPEPGIENRIYQNEVASFTPNTTYFYSYYKSHLRDDRPAPLPSVSNVIQANGFSYFTNSLNQLQKLPDGYYIHQDDFFLGSYKYIYVKMGVAEFVGESTFDPLYPFDPIDPDLYNPFGGGLLAPGQ
ncbi:hypothetical protein [Pedobacter agri]|uniref:Uncharacterized protein n=1 Tax=Pedobacter agri TaxID=454586 RepID=A0A9X3DF86_9SPHI|nr:hypothetical protein [Pedobacter agri]MCX3266554.1 hypothetical protein [Pedobacter agri]